MALFKLKKNTCIVANSYIFSSASQFKDFLSTENLTNTAASVPKWPLVLFLATLIVNRISCISQERGKNFKLIYVYKDVSAMLLWRQTEA